ncbi:hypothetical protein CB0940_08834 [Cercospora beticola]|uniref:Uncharacterized protein n=1 Tax=Cercospora beticola TaxID=122368 RepID=A0A2G5HRC8_CERBT|nr:hypothetical protein CB0940_08834 [Cercospora beticola]PIA95076.1 hypothetical protein CB0940_08834 [Cercospora beticola]CAK1365230.1 unnamed protein product [Cercospora beticola]
MPDAKLLADRVVVGSQALNILRRIKVLETFRTACIGDALLLERRPDISEQYNRLMTKSAMAVTYLVQKGTKSMMPEIRGRERVALGCCSMRLEGEKLLQLCLFE